ncbi:hypothetical protein [Acrocarpospora sp. B8E8]
MSPLVAEALRLDRLNDYRFDVAGHWQAASLRWRVVDGDELADDAPATP